MTSLYNQWELFFGNIIGVYFMCGNFIYFGFEDIKLCSCWSKMSLIKVQSLIKVMMDLPLSTHNKSELFCWRFV